MTYFRHKSLTDICNNDTKCNNATAFTFLRIFIGIIIPSSHKSLTDNCNNDTKCNNATASVLGIFKS